MDTSLVAYLTKPVTDQECQALGLVEDLLGADDVSLVLESRAAYLKELPTEYREGYIAGLVAAAFKLVHLADANPNDDFLKAALLYARDEIVQMTTV